VRLALVTHNVVKGGGQGRVNYELVRYCRSQGVAVHVLSETLAPELLDAGTTWDRIDPLLFRPELIHCMDFTPRVGKVIDRIRRDVDLIVANGAVLRRPHAVNICHFVHSAWRQSPAHDSRVRRGPYGWYQSMYSRCNARWERKAFDLARTVVAVSEKVREELVHDGIGKPKVQVILNGVDLQEFFPGKESRAELGLPRDAPLALFVGDIRTPRKNLDSVLRAVQQIGNIHLAVVGETRKSVFPRMATSLGLQDRVHFLGYRRDIPSLMRAADMFVFPSRYEACSLALLEALASGLPVITAVTAGGSELITRDSGEVLADPNDLPRLIAAIRRFLNVDQQRIARAAARAIAEQHSWDRMAADYLHLFQEHLQVGVSRCA
jgi:glycosyltransferase involved in cell wall biosynthesis